MHQNSAHGALERVSEMGWQRTAVNRYTVQTSSAHTPTPLSQRTLLINYKFSNKITENFRTGQ